VEQLADRYEKLAETGRGAFASIGAALFGLDRAQTTVIDSMDLLEEKDLSRLRAAIDDARKKLIGLKEEADSARDALAKLNAEIAAERGDDATAQRLELELEQRQRLAEAEKQLEQARAAGTRELIRLYEEQQAKLTQLYRLKEQNLEADLQAEQTGERTRSKISQVADEAERAERALGRLGQASLGGLLDQSSRLTLQFRSLSELL
jgi:chromosome segregation ATPase